MTNKLMEDKKLVKFTGPCPSCKTQVVDKGRCPGCGAYFRADGTLLFNGKPLKTTPKSEVKNAPKKEKRTRKTAVPATLKPAEPAPEPEGRQGNENGWFLFD